MIRLISDVHSKIDEYIQLTQRCYYSICLGDLSFDYEFLRLVDSNHHKFFAGNHDNHDDKQNWPHWIGDYGEFELNGIKGFFIGGAFSIDWQYRINHEMKTGYKSFWKNEQLSLTKLHDAVKLYKEIKPDLMLSHTFPTSWCKKNGSKKILKNFGYDPETFTTNTQECLQQCFEIHKPKLWHGGHFHFHRNFVWHGTRFICQPELGWTDINENLEVIGQSHQRQNSR